MKTSALFLLALPLFAFTACTGQDYSNDNYGNDNYSQQYDNGYGNQGQPQNQGYAVSNNQQGDQTQTAQGGENIVMQSIMDPKTNTPFSQIPLPASWKLNRSNEQGAPAISGPNGLKIYASGYRSFAYSNDQMMQQAYQSQGQQMRQPIGIDNVLRQDIMELGRKNGLTFVSQFPLPQVAQNDRSYSDQLYSVGQRNNVHQASGSEWTDKNGKKVFIVLHYNEMISPGMVQWGYYLQSLEADNSYYENAKNNYVNGLANVRYNQQRINAYNQNEQYNLNQNQVAHNQKMQNNQAAFDAQQRNHRETYDAINKSSMDAYRSNNESMDRNQHAFTNYINDQQTVTDPSNGQSYQVEGYSNQYWMNGNGEYIPSNNSLYNPNLDPNTYNQTWEEAPVNPYGK